MSAEPRRFRPWLRTRSASRCTRCRRSPAPGGRSSWTERTPPSAARRPEALAVATELARTLGLQPFELADDRRSLYHAGAAIASNYLVTLYRIASGLLAEAGAPPEALVPLMRQTIENGFELTGPIARGDWATVDAHLDAIRAAQPEVEPVYRVLAEATQP